MCDAVPTLYTCTLICDVGNLKLGLRHSTWSLNFRFSFPQQKEKEKKKKRKKKSKMHENELNSGTSIWVLNKCNARPNKTPNKGRSLNVC